MLGKLLKYDLRYVYKVLGVYYLICIASVTLGALFGQIKNPPFIIDFAGEFLLNAGFGLSIGLLITAFTRTWVRFRLNLYGDESYLTHTLPISRLQLFASKFICSVIVLLLSLVVVAIVLILYLSSVTGFDPGTFFADLFVTIQGTSFSVFYLGIVFTFLIITQSIFIIMCGFTGIIVGHRSDTARGIISAVAGISCYFATSALLVGIIFLLSAFNPELSALLTSGHQPDLPTLIDCMWACIATYAAITAIMFAVNVKLLNRGVDVE